jgi:hypothetical protein
MAQHLLTNPQLPLASEEKMIFCNTPFISGALRSARSFAQRGWRTKLELPAGGDRIGVCSPPHPFSPSVSDRRRCRAALYLQSEI